jgi:hypothetical protein
MFADERPTPRPKRVATKVTKVKKEAEVVPLTQPTPKAQPPPKTRAAQKAPPTHCFGPGKMCEINEMCTTFERHIDIEYMGEFFNHMEFDKAGVLQLTALNCVDIDEPLPPVGIQGNNLGHEVTLVHSQRCKNPSECCPHRDNKMDEDLCGRSHEKCCLACPKPRKCEGFALRFGGGWNYTLKATTHHTRQMLKSTVGQDAGPFGFPTEMISMHATTVCCDRGNTMFFGCRASWSKSEEPNVILRVRVDESGAVVDTELFRFGGPDVLITAMAVDVNGHLFVAISGVPHSRFQCGIRVFRST